LVCGLFFFVRVWSMFSTILRELADQRTKLKLIASENFASPAVLLAMGNWLSDKYAEGSPGHRFYAGCENVDTIESRAAELAPDLFQADRDTNLLDYDQIRGRAREERPLLILAGYSSYPRKINFRIFREIADEVGATLMVDMAHFAGLVAGKVFTGDFDPVAHAHIVTTTMHKTLRGPRGGLVLCHKERAATDRAPARARVAELLAQFRLYPGIEL
jgi:glycine/serine hydroxymethyltransferase